jgi:hypothetical protein
LIHSRRDLIGQGTSGRHPGRVGRLVRELRPLDGPTLTPASDPDAPPLPESELDYLRGLVEVDPERDIDRDLRKITCNMVEARSVYAAGARAYVLWTAGGRLRVLIRSRSGRWVERWVAPSFVRDVRATTIPPRHTLYARLVYAVPATEPLLSNLGNLTKRPDRESR